MTEISVVISSYNSLNKLKLCLNAYRNQTLEKFEVIVACDGSSDGTLDYIQENIHNFPFRLRCVWQEDKGYRLARIRNCGWRLATANRVVFTDNDIVPNSDCLANYACYKNTEAAITGYIGYIQENVHIAFTEESISRIKDFEPFMTSPEKRNMKKYNSWVLWGGNLSVTKQLYELTGGFDEDFISWGGEDTDLGVRCERMGHHIMVLPEAKMFHLDHPPSNSLDKSGSELFFNKKRYEQTIKRNTNAGYSDIIVIE